MKRLIVVEFKRMVKKEVERHKNCPWNNGLCVHSQEIPKGCWLVILEELDLL